MSIEQISALGVAQAALAQMAKFNDSEAAKHFQRAAQHPPGSELRGALLSLAGDFAALADDYRGALVTLRGAR